MTLSIGLSTTTTEPGLTGGHLDGIGVYSRALLHELPQAGVTVAPYSFGPAARLSVGQPMRHSFPLATLRDLALPGVREAMDVDLYHATDYRIIRMDRPIVATLHDALTSDEPGRIATAMRGFAKALRETRESLHASLNGTRD